jgi:hypothetical protein
MHTQSYHLNREKNVIVMNLKPIANAHQDKTERGER